MLWLRISRCSASTSSDMDSEKSTFTFGPIMERREAFDTAIAAPNTLGHPGGGAVCDTCRSGHASVRKSSVSCAPVIAQRKSFEQPIEAKTSDHISRSPQRSNARGSRCTPLAFVFDRDFRHLEITFPLIIKVHVNRVALKLVPNSPEVTRREHNRYSHIRSRSCPDNR